MREEGMKIAIFGYGYEGARFYRELVYSTNNEYDVIGFADNNTYKQGNIVDGFKIILMDDLTKLREKTFFRYYCC